MEVSEVYTDFQWSEDDEENLVFKLNYDIETWFNYNQIKSNVVMKGIKLIRGQPP